MRAQITSGSQGCRLILVPENSAEHEVLRKHLGPLEGGEARIEAVVAEAGVVEAKKGVQINLFDLDAAHIVFEPKERYGV